MTPDERTRPFSFEEAIDWLDRRGGRWNARASLRRVTVNVFLQGRRVQATAKRLRAADVRAALIKAVEEHRE